MLRRLTDGIPAATGVSPCPQNRHPSLGRARASQPGPQREQAGALQVGRLRGRRPAAERRAARRRERGRAAAPQRRACGRRQLCVQAAVARPVDRVSYRL